MAVPKGPTSNLKGIPYLIFAQVMFFQNNPDLLIQERLSVLFNVFAWIHAKYGDGDYKIEIHELSQALDAAQLRYEPLDGLAHATSRSNDIMVLLGEIQKRLYRLVVNLGILDEAGMGEAKWENY